jgi:hypothetical protein
MWNGTSEILATLEFCSKTYVYLKAMVNNTERTSQTCCANIFPNLFNELPFFEC